MSLNTDGTAKKNFSPTLSLDNVNLTKNFLAKACLKVFYDDVEALPKPKTELNHGLHCLT